MQNLENLDVFEILITQKLLKCPKDLFVRTALIYIYIYIERERERERDWCRHVKVNIASADRQVEREREKERERDWCRHIKVIIASADRQVERERVVQAHQIKHCIGGSTNREKEREREMCVCVCSF